MQPCKIRCTSITLSIYVFIRDSPMVRTSSRLKSLLAYLYPYGTGHFTSCVRIGMHSSRGRELSFSRCLLSHSRLFLQLSGKTGGGEKKKLPGYFLAYLMFTYFKTYFILGMSVIVVYCISCVLNS